MILGANYWPAGKGVYWWREFEISTVRRDFSLAAEYGFDLMRIFLLWEDFQPEINRVAVKTLEGLVRVADLAQDNEGPLHALGHLIDHHLGCGGEAEGRWLSEGGGLVPDWQRAGERLPRLFDLGYAADHVAGSSVQDYFAQSLALYCRRLRPDMQIVSRATYERNVETLHRAGADFVVSLTTMGANAIFNVLERGEVVTVSEGLNLFKLTVPAELVGRPLAETGLREDTGCSVVALMGAEGLRIGPPAHEPLPADADLVLIGTREAEQRFLQRFAR